jgi:8-oxo-dGTP pyrophosphatase MutT (NUDIX family)
MVFRRRAPPPVEFLLLHSARSRHVEGDWAWGPPAAARLPEEPVEQCAARELFDRTGLRLRLRAVPLDEYWAAFSAEAPATAAVVLSAEHDRFEWVPLETALERCRPARVAQQFGALAAAAAAA